MPQTEQRQINLQQIPTLRRVSPISKRIPPNLRQTLLEQRLRNLLIALGIIHNNLLNEDVHGPPVQLPHLRTGALLHE